LTFLVNLTEASFDSRFDLRKDAMKRKMRKPWMEKATRSPTMPRVELVLPMPVKNVRNERTRVENAVRRKMMLLKTRPTNVQKLVHWIQSFLMQLTFSVFLFLVEDFEESKGVTNKFAEVMKCQQHNCNATVGEEVEESNDDSSGNRVLHLGRLFILLDLLEIQFGEHVKVVGKLNDEVELVKEAHWVVWEVCPETRHVFGILLANNHFSAP
jgi:hypothetical protein